MLRFADNILSNFDNIASQPGGYGGGVVLGRWFLEILGLFAEKIGLDYNLSVINGLIFVCLIGCPQVFWCLFCKSNPGNRQR